MTLMKTKMKMKKICLRKRRKHLPPVVHLVGQEDKPKPILNATYPMMTRMILMNDVLIIVYSKKGFFHL